MGGKKAQSPLETFRKSRTTLEVELFVQQFIYSENLLFSWASHPPLNAFAGLLMGHEAVPYIFSLLQ